MAFTLNRRLAQLVDSNGQLNTGKIPNDYITSDHVADNTITSAMLHTSFTVSTSNLTAIDTDDVSEGSTNLYYTDARVGTYISGNRDYGNITTTGYLAGPATFTIDPAAVGDNTGTVVIAGNLQVDGTTTTINSTTLTVDDKLVTLASGSINAAAADGAGIDIDISGVTNPSLRYDGTNDEWSFNRDVNVDGNVGIGTTSPSALLHVASTGASNIKLEDTDNGFAATELNVENGGRDLKITTPQDTIFVQGSSESMRIIDGGNVGIGTNNPQETLHLFNSAQTWNQYANIRMSTENDSYAAEIGFHRGTSDDSDRGLFLSGDGTNKHVRILHGGNVGIGTSNPDSNLHVKSTSDVKLTLETDEDSDCWINLSGATSEASIGYEPATNTLRFSNAADGVTSNVRMVIDTSGNVGIGTDSPGHPLNVVDSGELQAEFSGYSHASAANNSRAASGSIRLGNGAGTTGLLIDYTDQGQTVGLIKNEYVASSSSELRLQSPFVSFYTGTSASEAMRITHDGAVAIGTGGAPASGFILDARGSVRIGDGTSTEQDIHFYNSNTEWQVGVNNGGNGTDSNQFYFYEGGNYRLTVQKGGNIGIGTASPDTSLQVNGTPQLLLHLNRAASTPGIKFTNGGSTSGTYGYMIADENEFGFGYYDGTSSTTIVRFDESGDVGIGGVIAPTGLEVYSKVCKFWHGNTNFFTMFEDQNEINTYTSAGANSTMYLQHPGGDLEVGAGIFFVDRSASSVGINTTSPSTQFHVKGTNNSAGDLYTAVGAGNVPSITIQNAGTTDNNNAALFFRNDSGMFASVGARFVNHTTDETELRFSTTNSSGTTRERVTIDGDGNVGIGTTDPAKLGLTGSSVGKVLNLSGDDCQVRLANTILHHDNSGNTTAYLRNHYTALGPDNNARLRLEAGKIIFATSNAYTERMRIDEYGYVTTPYNPAFRAYLSVEQTSNGEVTSGWADNNTTASRGYDRNGNFNVSNGRFTAPVDGVYVFSVMWDSLNSQAGFNFLVNGTDYNVMWEPTGLSNDAWESKYYGTHLKLSANDYVTLYIVHASGTNPVHQGSGVWGHFAGALIG